MAVHTEISFCPLCGAKITHEHRFGQIRPVCPACGYIHFKDPKVAAAVLVVGDDGRILLVRRVHPPFKGLWTLPAGFVNAGEDPARAAERECEEETGLRVRATRVLDVVAGREHPRGADFIIAYWAEVVSGNLRPGDDADRVAWFPPDHLPKLAFEATAKILAHL